MTETKTVMTNAAWRAEGARRFGTDDIMQWKFRCVSCGTESSPADFEKVNADPRRAPHECIGRHLKPVMHIDGNSKPCNWTAGGMFRLSSVVEIEGIEGKPTLAFPFADYIGGEPA
ncbi:hypothetical protein OG884_15695 [Streptosporangium sp. NBC_01755]|uniref:VVA0879 family protein n=1 Tax=Streptosporangium sp. NBC_01755 TaxID=2975949 RepID=UPI002DDA10EC|nr:VVA0879 family protein [Streptosporangium sp. NBC_01755]WSD03277.1 hypothetical protein OG884_15695 [Streptosporangium sp. NBC_01755]